SRAFPRTNFLRTSARGRKHVAFVATDSGRDCLAGSIAPRRAGSPHGFLKHADQSFTSKSRSQSDSRRARCQPSRSRAAVPRANFRRRIQSRVRKSFGERSRSEIVHRNRKTGALRLLVESRRSRRTFARERATSGL